MRNSWSLLKIAIFVRYEYYRPQNRNLTPLIKETEYNYSVMPIQGHAKDFRIPRTLIFSARENFLSAQVNSLALRNLSGALRKYIFWRRTRKPFCRLISTKHIFCSARLPHNVRKPVRTGFVLNIRNNIDINCVFKRRQPLHYCSRRREPSISINSIVFKQVLRIFWAEDEFHRGIFPVESPFLSEASLKLEFNLNTCSTLCTWKSLSCLC